MSTITREVPESLSKKERQVERARELDATKVDMTMIVSLLVGSQAHGLANEDSDFDYREVGIYPTKHILRLGKTLKESKWEEGAPRDTTGYEIGKFLHLATKSNPTILEMFHAPIDDKILDTPHELARVALDMLDLFPYVWNSLDVLNAHIGYGRNQRTKFLNDTGTRSGKFASAWLRSLYQAQQLLSEDVYPVSMVETPIFDTLREWKTGSGSWTRGAVSDVCEEWESKVEDAYRHRPDKETNLEPINEFLMDIRKRYFDSVPTTGR